MFETVRTCEEWWDGPRGGIADCQGQPHLFESEWRDIGADPNSIENTFRQFPVDEETFRLALEQWAIWRRWETTFHQGITPIDTHPALPEERTRYEELQRLLGRTAGHQSSAHISQNRLVSRTAGAFVVSARVRAAGSAVE